MDRIEPAASLKESARYAALIVGFGLHNAWVCASMYSTKVLFGVTAILPGPGGSGVALLYLASILAFSVTAFTAAAFDQALTRFARSRKVMGATAMLVFLATLLAFAPLGSEGAPWVADCVSGVLTGIGSAILLLYWGTAFARQPVKVIAVCGSAAIVGGFALNTLVLQSLPFPFGGIAAALLPFGELAALMQVTPLSIQEEKHLFNGMPAKKSRLALKLFTPMAFVGLALGIHKHISVQSTIGSLVTPESCIILLLAGSLTVSVFALYARLYPNGSWDVLLRVFVPALSCGALLLAILVFGNPTLSDLFLLIAYIFIETVVWVYYGFIAHKMHLSPIFIFGLSRGIITLFMLLGAVCAACASPYLEATPIGDISAIIISLVLIALGYALMPRESDILKTIAGCPAVRLVALAIEENLGPLARPISEMPRPAGTAESTEDATQDAPMPSAQVRQPVPAHDGMAGEGAAGSADGQAARPQPLRETAELAEDAPKSAARAAMEHPAVPATPGQGRFSAKVRRVAALYQLTERETDILFELAKGASTSYIQKRYFISASTVKTHVRNIYRKLDIHKRNDLLHLLEEMDDYQ